MVRSIRSTGSLSAEGSNGRWYLKAGQGQMTHEITCRGPHSDKNSEPPRRRLSPALTRNPVARPSQA